MRGHSVAGYQTTIWPEMTSPFPGIRNSVFNGSRLDFVDHENGYGALFGVDLQSKLFHERVLQRDRAVCVGGLGFEAVSRVGSEKYSQSPHKLGTQGAVGTQS